VQAKAMMLPILKGIVREAGEGVFTDADARAVLALIPDRVIDEDARDQIFANIDAFIESKLTAVDPFAEPTVEANDDAPTQEDLEFTAKKHGITVEEVKHRLGIK